jgi:hypothetical protein
MIAKLHSVRADQQKQSAEPSRLSKRAALSGVIDQYESSSAPSPSL